MRLQTAAALPMAKQAKGRTEIPSHWDTNRMLGCWSRVFSSVGRWQQLGDATSETDSAQNGCPAHLSVSWYLVIVVHV